MIVASADAEHCRLYVRACDRDRYLASLFAPPEKSAELYVLYAFNTEIARIRELAKEPMPGEIRLQWWADVIDAIYGGEPVDHNIARPLAQVIKANDLPKHAFKNLIAARRFDLYDDPMPGLKDLEGYLGETSSVLVQLAALILAGEEALPCAAAAGYAGVAWGLTGLLRALPVHRARGQCYIPKDMLAAQDLTPASVLAAQDSAALKLVFARLRHVARTRLGEARALLDAMPLQVLPAFLPLCLVQGYLKIMDRPSFDVMTQIARRPQWRRQIDLWRCHRSEQF